MIKLRVAELALDKIPDASKTIRFKQDFLEDISDLFFRLVDLTEPICLAINSDRADMDIFDSSGIEALVTENNPKYANRITKQIKAYAKAMRFDDSYGPYKAAYDSMPSHSAAHPLINPRTFLGDAAFDSVILYRDLLSGDTLGTDDSGNGIHFQRAYIPLNSRAGLEHANYCINGDGIPCCPNDPSLPMKHEGTSKLRNGVTRYKFVCPKIK